MALQLPINAPPPGLDVTLVRQQDTGKFDFQVASSGLNKGNPNFDATRTHAVLTTLLSWKRGRRPQSQVAEGGYYWDPSGLRGTLLWTIAQDRVATASQLVAYADDGGQQLISSKYVASFTSSAERLRAGAYRLRVNWTTPTGNWHATLTV